MNKNIVICSDGTGNSAIKGRGTNVFRLYEAVDRDGDRPQVAIYDDGVGTDDARLFKILGGAFGWGLSRNVKHLYTELARVYEPDDQIFMFGFSRGAFTVRTLAGMMHAVGIPELAKIASAGLTLEAVVDQAYRQYRRRYRRVFFADKDILKQRRNQFRKDFAYDWEAVGRNGKSLNEHQVPIRFMGVWDTVDAVGLPVKEVADVLNAFYRFKFPDARLSPTVCQACHALAIDDERQTFHPLMWDESNEPKHEPGEIEQVWFAGAHSNVGGGYPRHGLAMATLDWMMERASKAGLQFLELERDRVRAHAHVHDKLYDSRTGLSGYYRYGPRDIKTICDMNNVDVKLHQTAIVRMARGTEGYCPGNIPSEYKVTFSGIQRQTEIVKQRRRADPPKLKTSSASIVGRRVHHVLFGLVALLLLWTATMLPWPFGAYVPCLIIALGVVVWVLIAGMYSWLRIKAVANKSEFHELAAEMRTASKLLCWAFVLGLITWLGSCVPQPPWWSNEWVASNTMIYGGLAWPWPSFRTFLVVLVPAIAFGVVTLLASIAMIRCREPAKSRLLCIWGLVGGIFVLSLGTTLAISWATIVFVVGLLPMFRSLRQWSEAELLHHCQAQWPNDRRIDLDKKILQRRPP